MVFVGIEVVAANKTSLLDEYDVLCDNQATINVFRNKKLLKHIRSIDDEVSVSGVGGSLDLTMKGDLPGFGEVYYHPDCLANILCFHDLAEQKLVRFDENKNIFIVNINILLYDKYNTSVFSTGASKIIRSSATRPIIEYLILTYNIVESL